LETLGHLSLKLRFKPIEHCQNLFQQDQDID